MGNYWNRDLCADLITFFAPITGNITADYLSSDDGAVALIRETGDPNRILFLDGTRIVRYDFSLTVRCNGQDSAARAAAIGKLRAAAEYCESATPTQRSHVRTRKFPTLSHRSATGSEEYRAEFSLYADLPAKETSL